MSSRAMAGGRRGEAGRARGPRARPRLRSCLYPCSLRASPSGAGAGARARAGRAHAGARVCLPACARPRHAPRYFAMEARVGSRSSEEDSAPLAVVAVAARSVARHPGGGPRRATGRLVESTQAEDRRLIGLVGARPLLYARSTLPVASYYSQVKKLWQEVADLMGWTVAEVRRKWSHIRNSYSRHLRNEIHGLRTGRGRMVSRWYLADDLEFLRQHMATDTRPSASSYSMVTMSPFAPSLLQMEVSSVEDETSGPGAEAGGTGATWYSTPEGPPHDDSCGAHSFEPEETADYFHFFRGLYSDYQELTLVKQRKFRRQCLLLLHELVDEAGRGGDTGGAEDDASDAEEDQKCFVENLEIINGTAASIAADTTGADTTGAATTGAVTTGADTGAGAADAADAR